MRFDDDERAALDAAAKRIGVSVSTVHNYRTGRADPSLRVAFAIEDAYKVPARAWLVT